MGDSEAPPPVDPPGTVRILKHGAQVEAGWLLADGSEYRRDEQKRLFKVCGTIYGSGDGETTFNIPDVRSRVWVDNNGDGGTWVNVRGEIKT